MAQKEGGGLLPCDDESDTSPGPSFGPVTYIGTCTVYLHGQIHLCRQISICVGKFLGNFFALRAQANLNQIWRSPGLGQTEMAPTHTYSIVSIVSIVSTVIERRALLQRDTNPPQLDQSCTAGSEGLGRGHGGAVGWEPCRGRQGRVRAANSRGRAG